MAQHVPQPVVEQQPNTAAAAAAVATASSTTTTAAAVVAGVTTATTSTTVATSTATNVAINYNKNNNNNKNNVVVITSTNNNEYNSNNSTITPQQQQQQTNNINDNHNNNNNNNNNGSHMLYTVATTQSVTGTTTTTLPPLAATIYNQQPIHAGYVQAVPQASPTGGTAPTATAAPAHAIYPATMLSAHIPSNMYVNNVNANLYGWPHAAYIPAGTTHYIHGDIPTDQSGTVMQTLPLQLTAASVPVTSGGNNNSSGMGTRGARRGRGRGNMNGSNMSMRNSNRGDYHHAHINHSRHSGPLLETPVGMQPMIALTAAGTPNAPAMLTHSLPEPQQQTMSQASQQHQNVMTSQNQTQHNTQPLQQQHQQQESNNSGFPPTYAPLPAQYATAQIAYAPYAPYQTYYTTTPPGGHILHAAHVGAQGATRAPLYVTPLYNAPPMYNYLGEYICPPVLQSADYQYVPSDVGVPTDAQVLDVNGQAHDAMLPSLWTAPQVYATAAPAPGAEYESGMLSPGFTVYDQQMHEMQQQMNVMQIYDDANQLSVSAPISPVAMLATQPQIMQLEDNLSESGATHSSSSSTQMIMSVHDAAQQEQQIALEPVLIIPEQLQQTLDKPDVVIADEYVMQDIVQNTNEATMYNQHQQNLQQTSDMDFEVVNNIKINCKKIQPEFSNVVSLNNEHYECDQLEQQQQQQQKQQNKLELQQKQENRQYEKEQQEQYVMPNKSQKSYKNKQQKQHTEQHNMQYDEQQQQQQQQQQQPMLKKSYNQNISKDQRRKSPTQHHQQQNDNQKARRNKHNDVEQNVENSLHINNNHENINHTNINTRSKTMAWTNSNNKKQTTTVAITATPMNHNKQQLVEQQTQCHRTTYRLHETQSNKNQIENGCLATPLSSIATTEDSNEQLAAATSITTTATTMTTIVTTSSASTSAVPKQIVNETTTTAAKIINVNNKNNNNNNNAHRAGVNNQNNSNTTTNAKQQTTIVAAQRKPSTTAIITKDIATTTTALVTTTTSAAAINNNKDANTEKTATTTTTTATTTTTQEPLMSLAPPVSSTTTPTTGTWASLFLNETNVANNINNNYAATVKTVLANQINASTINNNNNNNNNNINNNNTNNHNNKNSNNSKNAESSTNLREENSSTKKFIIKVKRCDNLVTNNNVTPISPIITPGAMSYAATSARGLANANAAAAKVTKTDNATMTISKTVQTVAQKVKLPKRPEQIDEWTHKYGDFLNKFKTDLQAISLRPRGLTNRSNYCYINCILQALIGCPPFYNLLKSIPRQAAALSDVKTPTVNAMMHFVNNFALLRGTGGAVLRTHNRKSNKDDINNDLQSDPAFEPTDIYKLWNEGRAEHAEGRQEDAEEFLGYVLNQLNDEMMEVINLIGNKSNGAQNGQKYQTTAEDGDDWQMICNNRNKVSFTRQTDFGRTPLSDIFRGELRSRLQREGEHPTDVVQPFFTLQLNIERAASVKEALEILVGRDQVEGVTGSKSKQEVQAWQQTTLEKLPIVLIMHLKWFDYRSDGCTKILKKVEIPVELKIDAKIMASKKYSPKQRSYRLFAVVYHDGQEATKGHYITDVYHTGYESWLRYDDNYVKPVSEHHVLSPTSPRVPYLLFYRRCDSLPMVSVGMSAKPQQQH